MVMLLGDLIILSIWEKLRRYDEELLISSHNYMINLTPRGWHYYSYHSSNSYRQLRGGLIFLYKILNNCFNTDFLIYIPTPQLPLSGHQFKLFIKECSGLLCRWNHGITKDWNSLPNYVVNSSSINTFKSLLDSYLLDLRFFIRWFHWYGIYAVPLPMHI